MKLNFEAFGRSPRVIAIFIILGLIAFYAIHGDVLLRQKSKNISSTAALHVAVSNIISYHPYHKRAVVKMFDDNWQYLCCIPREYYNLSLMLDKGLSSPFGDAVPMDMFVYEQDGVAVGFVSSYIAYRVTAQGMSKDGVIQFLVVDEKSRKHGIAQKLMEYIIQHLYNRYTVDRVTMNVYTDNTYAQNFYFKLGFSIWYVEGKNMQLIYEGPLKPAEQKI